MASRAGVSLVPDHFDGFPYEVPFVANLQVGRLHVGGSLLSRRPAGAAKAAQDQAAPALLSRPESMATASISRQPSTDFVNEKSGLHALRRAAAGKG